MKKLSAKFILAVIVNVMLTSVSYAETNRFDVWDELDGAAAILFNDQEIDEDEYRNSEEILGLGRTGETEEAIKALNTFLKDSHNGALREVASQTMAALISQRRVDAALAIRRATERSACSLDMKVCPDGATVVEREGPQCMFAQCPRRQ